MSIERYNGGGRPRVPTILKIAFAGGLVVSGSALYSEHVEEQALQAPECAPLYSDLGQTDLEPELKDTLDAFDYDGTVVRVTILGDTVSGAPSGQQLTDYGMDTLARCGTAEDSMLVVTASPESGEVNLAGKGFAKTYTEGEGVSQAVQQFKIDSADKATSPQEDVDWLLTHILADTDRQPGVPSTANEFDDIYSDVVAGARQFITDVQDSDAPDLPPPPPLLPILSFTAGLAIGARLQRGHVIRSDAKRAKIDADLPLQLATTASNANLFAGLLHPDDEAKLRTGIAQVEAQSEVVDREQQHYGQALRRARLSPWPSKSALKNLRLDLEHQQAAASQTESELQEQVSRGQEKLVAIDKHEQSVAETIQQFRISIERARDNGWNTSIYEANLGALTEYRDRVTEVRFRPFVDANIRFQSEDLVQISQGIFEVDSLDSYLENATNLADTQQQSVSTMSEAQAANEALLERLADEYHPACTAGFSELAERLRERLALAQERAAQAAALQGVKDPRAISAILFAGDDIEKVRKDFETLSGRLAEEAGKLDGLAEALPVSVSNIRAGLDETARLLQGERAADISDETRQIIEQLAARFGAIEDQSSAEKPEYIRLAIEVQDFDKAFSETMKNADHQLAETPKLRLELAAHYQAAQKAISEARVLARQAGNPAAADIPLEELVGPLLDLDVNASRSELDRQLNNFLAIKKSVKLAMQKQLGIDPGRHRTNDDVTYTDPWSQQQYIIERADNLLYRDNIRRRNKY